MATSAAGHAGLAAGKWSSLSLIEQLANIGSEVSRAVSAHEAGRQDRRDAAVDRGLELFDLTAADDRWRGARRREVLRAREEFCALFWGGGRGGDDAASLNRYFFHFAIAARRAAGRA